MKDFSSKEYILLATKYILGTNVGTAEVLRRNSGNAEPKFLLTFSETVPYSFRGFSASH